MNFKQESEGDYIYNWCLMENHQNAKKTPFVESIQSKVANITCATLFKMQAPKTFSCDEILRTKNFKNNIEVALNNSSCCLQVF